MLRKIILYAFFSPYFGLCQTPSSTAAVKYFIMSILCFKFYQHLINSKQAWSSDKPDQLLTADCFSKLFQVGNKKRDLPDILCPDPFQCREHFLQIIKPGKIYCFFIKNRFPRLKIKSILLKHFFFQILNDLLLSFSQPFFFLL